MQHAFDTNMLAIIYFTLTKGILLYTIDDNIRTIIY